MRLTTFNSEILILEDEHRWWVNLWYAVSLYVLVASCVSLAHGQFKKGAGGCTVAVMTAALAACFSERSIFEFRRKEGELVWRRRSLVGSRSGTIGFTNIKMVAIENTPSGSALLYRIVLVTNDGPFPLGKVYESNEKRFEDIARAIRVVLGQSADQSADTNLAVLVAEGRIIDAVTLAKRRYGMNLTQARQYVEQFHQKESEEPK